LLFQQPIPDVAQKGRGPPVALLPLPVAAAGVGEKETVFRPGDTDEKETALLGGVGLAFVGTEAMGKQAVLAADEEDDAELQAFGGVQGQEGDALGSGIVQV